MLPPNLTAHPPKQKAKKYARSQSVPVELEAQHDDKETSQMSKKNFLELYKLVWTYAQITQDRVFDQGKIAYKYVKHFSFGYLKTKMHHKSNAIKFGLKILGKMSLYLYHEKMYLIFAYLSMIISSITATKLPQLVGKMIDISVVEHNSNELMEQAKFFFCIAVIHLISEFFWNHLFAMLSQRIRWSLKEQMYSALLKREIEYFDKRPLNDVINSVNGLIGRVENICTVDVANLVRNAIQFAYCAWMLTNISLKLTGLIIMIVPFHILLPMVFQKFKARHNAAEWDVICRTEKTVMETFQNVRIVKAFSTEDSELEKYNKLLDANHDASLKSSKSGSLNMAMSGFFTNFTLLCVIYVGMVLVNKGEVSPGSLSSFLLLSMAVSTSFRDCTFNYMQLKEKIPACQTLFGIMEDAPKIPHKGGKKIENFEGNVELENVHFSYPVAPDVPILKGVSFKIKAGQSAAFVGMSGGGKSTIISLLLRFYDISDGSVKLDGVDIRDVDLQWLHSHFGFVSQDPILFSGTIEQNITYGLQSYTQETLLKAINMANATFIFNKDLFPNGLQSDIGERGGALSGGQKQRLAIARALMREPKVLILDEATSNLDANAEFEVQTAIDNLITSSNLTVITIAHRLSTIIKCDVIFVLKSGQVVEQGNHKELVARGGVYKNLVEKQFQTPSHH